MIKKTNKHNGVISFWKFMFTLLIFILHYGAYYDQINVKYKFGAGSIGVDFFFIVSGFLFCNSILRRYNEYKVKDQANYFKNKVIYFFKFYLFLWILGILYCLFISKNDLSYILKNIFTSFYFYTPGTLDAIFGIVWYISALLIIEFLLFPIIINLKDKYIYYFTLLIVFFTGGYLFIKYGTLSYPWDTNMFCYKGIIRGLFDMNIGIFLYGINKKVNNINFTDFSKFLLTIIEILGYLSIFYLVNKVDAHYKYDAIMVLILSVSILISFSKQSLLYDFCCNNLNYYLEKISLPIYVNQWFIIYLVGFIVSKFNISIGYYKLFLIELLISFILGVLEFKIFDLINKYKYKIKKIFINN